MRLKLVICFQVKQFFGDPETEFKEGFHVNKKWLFQALTCKINLRRLRIGKHHGHPEEVETMHSLQTTAPILKAVSRNLDVPETQMVQQKTNELEKSWRLRPDHAASKLDWSPDRCIIESEKY